MSPLLLIAAVQSQDRVRSVVGDLRIEPAFHSKVLGNDRPIRVWLPPSYGSSPSRRYPVLYMHDGQNVFDGMTSYLPNIEWRVDETGTALMQSRLVDELIIVGIDNAGMARADEYLPTRLKRDDGGAWGGNADKYLRFVTDEVMPWVDKTYRTKKGPANTGLCGSSFGGVVTLYMGLQRPDVFGRIAVVSPSLWWDDQLMTKRVAELPKKLPLRIWIDMGTKEGADSVDQLKRMEGTLQKKGWTLGKDLACYVDTGAVHNEDAWAKRMGMILEFLFPAKG
ncbi:MAG: alpha/beta hydrolase [Armatimonadetes bacterium]|nr:alpha/beta hydrolase [Armatimonadota bacterium]